MQGNSIQQYNIRISSLWPDLNDALRRTVNVGFCASNWRRRTWWGSVRPGAAPDSDGGSKNVSSQRRGGKEHGAQRSVPGLETKFLLFGAGQERDSVRPRTGDRALAASAFGSDHARPLHGRGRLPGRLRVLPAPDIPGNPSQPKVRPRRYQDGPSSCASTRSGGEMGIDWTP